MEPIEFILPRPCSLGLTIRRFDDEDDVGVVETAEVVETIENAEAF